MIMRPRARAELRAMFRRGPATDSCPALAAARSSGQIPWNYDRSEIFADAVVHATGIVLGLVGTVAMLVMVIRHKPIELTPALVYSVGLLVMLTVSAAYNLWPVSPTKWLLRRLDHSAIYLLIAGTYTPFLSLLKSGAAWAVLTAGIWSSAVVGMALKLALPGRFDRLSIVFYFLIGFSGLLAYQYFIPVVPSMALWLLVLGGIFYSVGTVFHLWESLRFQNAIWHGCVLIAAVSHYVAVLTCLAAA